jgi:hypothetical protein
MNRRRYCVLSVVAPLIAMLTSIPASGQDLPFLQTNEAYVEEVSRATTLAVDDPMAVLAFVFDSLPERVKVYPTENYYYFSFIHNGVRYAGNIRIEPHDSGEVAVHFTYYQDASDWREDSPMTHVVLDASRGVTVEKLERLVYRLSYGGKRVVFALNDLSRVKPPTTAIGPNEAFIGPIFDESAIRFFLVFNSKLRLFHYLLDETAKLADEFFLSKRTDRILVGKRTGFAFYRDHRLDRKILIGVYQGNVRVNNYFDGPFDQLPDNFIEGEALRRAILEVEPRLKGQIDRFGSSPTGEVRFMIDPYMQYQHVDDLDVFHRCATSKVRSDSYYKCFVSADRGPDDASRGLKKKPVRKSRLTEKPSQSR